MTSCPSCHAPQNMHVAALSAKDESPPELHVLVTCRKSRHRAEMKAQWMAQAFRTFWMWEASVSYGLTYEQVLTIPVGDAAAISTTAKRFVPTND